MGRSARFLICSVFVAVGLTGCGDPTFDPRAPIEFSVSGSAGVLVFCDPFVATQVIVASRPIDNSEQWTTLLNASGTMTFERLETLAIDRIPEGTTGTVDAVAELGATTVSVLAVARDEAAQNIRAQFSIPVNGMAEGAWIDGQGEVSAEPCAAG